MNKVLLAQCNNCTGTGLTIVAVGSSAKVCSNCNGTGEQKVTYIPFNGIVKRDDVNTVIFEDVNMRYSTFLKQVRRGIRIIC